MSEENFSKEVRDGEVFGEWTVLKAFTEEEGKALCKCSCGEEKKVRRMNLRDGKSTSCGCSIKNQENDSKFFIGAKFGHWEIVCYDGKGRDVKCKCTNCWSDKNQVIKTLDKWVLSRGVSSSCGCIKLDPENFKRKINGEEINPVYKWKSTNPPQTANKGRVAVNSKINVGDKFGEWEVIKITIGESRVLCKCSCGNEKEVLRQNLNNGKSTSCGCSLKDMKVEQSFSIGSKFEFWEVVEYDGKSRFVNCKCTGCSTIKNPVIKKLDKWALVRGTTTSCGCQKQKKRGETNLEKYGSEIAVKSDSIKQVLKNSIGLVLEERGEEIQEKKSVSMLQTLVERGDEIDAQKKKTCLERYGVENITQLPQYRNRVRDWSNDNPGKCFISKPELSLLAFVQQYYPSAKKSRILNDDNLSYELDIYIPELEVAIEHNGLYRHSIQQLADRKNIEDPMTYHLYKSNLCKSSNVRLIHIWENEWKSRKQVVKNYLLNILNSNKIAIEARHCDFKIYNHSDEVSTFIKSNNLESNWTFSSRMLSLKLKDRIVFACIINDNNILSHLTYDYSYQVNNLFKYLAIVFPGVQFLIDYRLGIDSAFKDCKIMREIEPQAFYWNEKTISDKNVSWIKTADSKFEIYDSGKLLLKM